MTGLLTFNAVDCNAQGQILFDHKSMSGQHSIKCFTKMKQEDRYSYNLEGQKKILRFFNSYVLEVKTDRNQDKI